MASQGIHRERPAVRRSIRTRLLVLLLGLTALSVLTVGYLGVSVVQDVGQRAQQVSAEALRTQAEEYLRRVTEGDARRNDLILNRVQQDAEKVAQYAATVFGNSEALLGGAYWQPEAHMFVGPEGQYINSESDTSSVFVPNFVERDEDLMRALELSAYLDLILVPTYENDPNTVAVYLATEQEITRYYPNINLGSLVPPDFQVTQRPWYVGAAPENNPERRVVWSPVYTDATGKGLLVTAAAPVYTDRGEFVGVVGIDVTLGDISASVEANRLLGSGYSFLISSDGYGIALPEQGYQDILGRSPQPDEVMPDLHEATPAFSSVLEKMMAGSTGFEVVQVGERELFVAYAPLESTGWSLANVVEAGAVLQALASLQDELEASTRSLMLGRILPVGGAIFALVAVVGLLLARRLTDPIHEIAEAAQQIGAGRWDTPLPRPGDDEIGALSRAFATMIAQLRELIGTLEQRVAERTAALERRSLQLEAAAQVAREAAAIRDVGELLGRVVRLISDRFGFYHAGIFLLDEGKEYAVLRAASSEGGRRMLERGHRLKVGEEGIVGYVAGSGEPRIALDVGEDAVYFDNPDLPATRSEMALPLKVRGEVIGVLDVQSEEPAAFTDEDVAVLQTMADQIALAIENARLLREAQERLQEVNLLLGRREQEVWKRLAAKRARWGYVYNGVEVAPKQEAEGLEAEPHMMVPLQTRGGPIGRLVVSLPDHPLTPDEEALIQQVAEQAGLALENARLFQEMQQTLAEMEALYRASRAIGEATSMQGIVQGAAEVAAALGFSACSLTLVTATDEAGVPVRGDIYSVLSGEGGFVSIPPIRDFPITDRVAAQGVLEDSELVLIYEDAADPQSPMPEAVRETMRNMGMRGMVTLGLTTGGRPLGFLTFSSLEPLAGLTEERIRRVRTVADQVSIAVERRRLLEQTLQRAERERLRAEIASRVRASTNVDTILQTAIRELGRALRASEGLIRLQIGDGAGSVGGGAEEDEYADVE